MPIFEYACPKCGYVFEKLVLSKSQPEPACPKCGSARTDQKFSTFAAASAVARPSGASCAPSGGG